jgi:putative phosphonate catabolism associated alcohol dehydrogenase
MDISLTAIFNSAESSILLKSIPIPSLKKGEILVKNEFVTLCKSDIHTFCGKRNEKTPTILGHEVVGIIEAFGEGIPFSDVRNEELKVGDRISWAIFSSNPESTLSLEGIPQKGEELIKYGHEYLDDESTLHGGLSQYLIIRKNTPVAKIDNQISLPVAALINCSVATMAGAIRLLDKIQNNHFLVLGAGMLGLSACAMLKTLGAKSISVVENNPQRLEQSKKFGVDYTYLSIEALKSASAADFRNYHPFHGLIETTGIPSIIEQSLDVLRIGGTSVWVGAVFPERNISLSAEKIVRNLLNIKGLHNYNIQDFIQAVQFVEEHHANFPFLQLVEGTFSLKEVNEAFNFAISNNSIRVGIQIAE